MNSKNAFRTIEDKNKQKTSYLFTLDELTEEAGDIEEDFALLNSFTGNRETKLAKIHAFLKEMYE